MWAAHVARRQLQDGLAALDLPVPPTDPAGRRAVTAVLARLRASCLVRSAVLQAWDAGHGRPRALVIGVRSAGDGVAAHAWLEGERQPRPFFELVRHPAPPIAELP